MLRTAMDPLLSGTAPSTSATRATAAVRGMPRLPLEDLLPQPRLSESSLFSAGVSTVILANTAVIALESIYIREQMVLFDLLEVFFATLYTMEICWRIQERGLLTFMCKDEWWWSWFDLLVVLLSILDIALSTVMGFSAQASAVRTFRILRVLRMFRILRFIGEADDVVIRVGKAVLKLLLVVTLIIFIAAVIATNLLWDCSDPGVADTFQDLAQSIWSMCKLMTLGDWTLVNEQVSEVKPGMLVFFMAFAFTTSTVLASLVPVIFLELSLKTCAVNGEGERWEETSLWLNELSTAVQEELHEMRMDTAQLEREIAKMIQSAETKILKSLMSNLDRDAHDEDRNTRPWENSAVSVSDVHPHMSGSFKSPMEDIKEDGQNPKQDRSIQFCASNPNQNDLEHTSSHSTIEKNLQPREHSRRNHTFLTSVSLEDADLPSNFFTPYLQGAARSPRQAVQGGGDCTPRSQVLLAAQRKLAAFEDAAGRTSSASSRSALGNWTPSASEIGSVWKFESTKGLASQAYAFISDDVAPQARRDEAQYLKGEDSLRQICEQAVPRERSADRDCQEPPKIWPLAFRYSTGRARASPARSDVSKDPPSPIPVDCPSADMFRAASDSVQTMVI